MNEHVQSDLIPYLRGELAPPERRRVEAHLAACAPCVEAKSAFARLMTELEGVAPVPPPVHWGAYRAELREKMERRTARPGQRGWWFLGPAPVPLAAGLVAVLAYIHVVGLPARGPGGAEHAAIENAILASQLDLIARIDVVERLDLLEDFEVIRRLDGLILKG